MRLALYIVILNAGFFVEIILLYTGLYPYSFLRFQRVCVCVCVKPAAACDETACDAVEVDR